MESLVNFENLKELIYYYAISDRNGISILNKNLEKENYVNINFYIIIIIILFFFYMF